MRLPPTLAGVFVAVALAAGLTACGDDGYSAPEREVTMAEVLENPPTILSLLDHETYVQAWEAVAEVEGLDPTDPRSFLEQYESAAIPSRSLTEAVVGCAWGAALRDADGAGLPDRWRDQVGSTEGFEDLRESILDHTGAGDCSTLDRHDIARLTRDLPGSADDLATWLFQAEVHQLEGSIGLELAPEIAEAYAG